MAALSFEFHFGEDLIESDVLDEFQAAVNELSPTCINSGVPSVEVAASA